MDAKSKMQRKLAVAVAVFVAACLAACGLRACTDGGDNGQPEQDTPPVEQVQQDVEGEGTEQPAEEEVTFSEEQERLLASAGDDEEAAIAVLCDGIWTGPSQATLQFFGNGSFVETFKDAPDAAHSVAIHVLDLNQEGIGSAAKATYLLQAVTDTGEHVMTLSQHAAPQGGEEYWELESDDAFVHGTKFQLSKTADAFEITGVEALSPSLVDLERIGDAVEELGAWCHMKYPTATMAAWDKTADFDLEDGTLTMGFLLDNSTNTKLDLKIDLADYSWTVEKAKQGGM